MNKIFLSCILAVAASCTGNVQKGNNNVADSTAVIGQSGSAENQKRKKMWEEANQYKASITDTTFLKTKGEMSYSAIDAMTGEGFNENYAFNQVVYLKALERARKHLSLKGNQLTFNLNNGAEIYIAEDLYKFISETFDLWNTQLKSGKFELKKDEQGVYDLYPVAR